MKPFAEFAAELDGYSPLELTRMLWDLSASFERILLAGGDTRQRARTAMAFPPRLGVEIRGVSTDQTKRIEED